MRARFEQVTRRFGSHVAADAIDLGVRPEDVELSRTPLGDGWREARVVVVEPTGNETIATVERDGMRVVARGGADPIARPDDVGWMRFAADRVMYFDHATGDRIDVGIATRQSRQQNTQKNQTTETQRSCSRTQ